MEAKTIEAIITIGFGVYQVLQKRGVWEKVKDFALGQNPQDVLVLGASGAGKTAFLRSIRGLNPYIPTGDRTDKVSEVDGHIQGAAFRFIDTPGQDEDKEKRIEPILGAYNRRPLGIINVVSFGYHEGVPPKSVAIKRSRPAPEYLEARRQAEIDRLAEWSSTLCGRGGPAAWLVTAVTKADLWWGPGEDQPVLEHYRSGPYHEALGEARDVTHSVRPCSSLNQLFYGVSAMSGYYSDRRRADDWDSLIALLMERAGEHRA